MEHMSTLVVVGTECSNLLPSANTPSRDILFQRVHRALKLAELAIPGELSEPRRPV